MYARKAVSEGMIYNAYERNLFHQNIIHFDYYVSLSAAVFIFHYPYFARSVESSSFIEPLSRGASFLLRAQERTDARLGLGHHTTPHHTTPQHTTNDTRTVNGRPSLSNPNNTVQNRRRMSSNATGIDQKVETPETETPLNGCQ
jgi:hypothetical protein